MVRCNCVQPDPRSGTRLINDEHLSLSVEFNTSYRLTVEDTKGMPPSEKKVRYRCQVKRRRWYHRFRIAIMLGLYFCHIPFYPHLMTPPLLLL